MIYTGDSLLGYSYVLIKRHFKTLHAHRAQALQSCASLLGGDFNIGYSRWRKIFLILNTWDSNCARTIICAVGLHTKNCRSESLGET